MTTIQQTGSQPPAGLNPIQWLKKNLFSTWFNTLLTFVSALVIFFVLKGLFTWVLTAADWTPVVKNLKLFAVGQYPIEEMWRVGTILAIVSFLMGLSWGVWGGTVRTFAIALAVGFTLIALLPFDLYPGNENQPDLILRLGFIAHPILVVMGYSLGRTSVVKSRFLLGLWLISFVLTILLLRGFEGNQILPRVATGLWGGLLLTFLLALVGIVASFPIGILLALGRWSSLPMVKLFCTLFIELVRGVPLVTILFMASIILPLFLPENLRIDRVMRAMLGMTLFAAAYMAENVRGGLQAIPKGQIEAAHAVGLTGSQTMLLIVLPQALRIVIPAIVGQFIALFMDTTLAIMVGLVELLAVGKTVLNSNPAWLLKDKEVYLFIAVLFWLFTYSMSYASHKLEVALGVGKR
ncbi:MAG: amino acid ABC transporter permease [Chloroflexi bacterium HGW-Chloroflexi-1]|nr:MAG: amino acid ABC transporter permease [Chloroflexi bacterium HGW-Chloroflexi-1]